MFAVGVLLRRSDLPPSAHRRARPESSEVCSSVSASKEIHSFSGIARKTVETRVSINAAMIPTQKSAFAIFLSSSRGKTLTSTPVASNAVPKLLCNRWMGGVNSGVSWCE